MSAVSPSSSSADTSAPAAMEHMRLWNETQTDYPRDRTVAQLFEEVASAYPQSVALVCENREVTYAELNARANRLAHRLRALGIGPESMVGCCLERSVELIIATLAVLKAGGAYVPLDPAYPKERLALLIGDTRTQIMLTQSSIASTILADYPQTCLAVDQEDAVSGLPDGNPPPAGGPQSLAYVMYTSGSTGRPKGVMVENRAIVRLVRNTNFCRFGRDEVFLQFAPISFDASTLEIWGPLLNGGRLVIMPAAAASLADLGRAIQRHGVTVLWLTAGLFHLMVEERIQDLRPLRQLLAGGDVLSSRHVRLALENLPNCTLINGYGPTENTTFTCCHTMRPGEPVPDPVPIGRPISNSQVYILDQQLRPVPSGVVGQLYAAGDGLARGYLNNPEATEQKFLPNPFVTERGARMYRTGDLARWRADGIVEFLGRDDNQVKIAGHRIEPGEIEAALGKHDQLKQVCVVPQVDANGSKRLVAYYVSSVPGIEPTDLRRFLADRVPQHMIPALFVPATSFPLTPNGKVDRSALAALSVAAKADEAVKTGTPLEQLIVDIWRTCIGSEQIGLDDNFFDLGGSSLALVSVHSKLQNALRSEIPITALFEFTTVRSLARHLGGRTNPEPAVSDAQQRAHRQRAAFARQRERRVGSAS